MILAAKTDEIDIIGCCQQSRSRQAVADHRQRLDVLQKRSDGAGRGGIIEHDHLAGFDIVESRARQRCLFGSPNRHAVTEGAFIDTGWLRGDRAMQLAQDALLRQMVDMAMNGHARHAEMLGQIVKPHLAELDDIVGNFFAPFVCLDHAPSPPVVSASCSISGQTGFSVSAIRQ